MNIFDVIKKETGSHLEKPAAVEGENTCSYGQLIDAVTKMALILEENGVKRLHRVAFISDNSIDYIVFSLAILSLNAVIVPVSPEHTQTEIDDVIKSIDTDFIIFSQGAYSVDDPGKIVINGFGNKFYLIPREAKTKPPEEYFRINPAFIRFSSGTTGEKKGVVLSHESIVERTDQADKGLKITSGDNIAWILSMSFHFVVTILLFLRRGATIVICNHPFVETVATAFKKPGLSVIYASPFHYNMFSNSREISKESFRDIRMAISTAVKLPENIREEFEEKFGFGLTEAYGIIEVGLPFVAPSASREKESTFGKPLPGYEVSIFEPDENHVGEILLRGKGLLDAYFSPWQGRSEVLQDGWFNTGDVGFVNVDGYLVIVGRKKNVINFTGMKIFPHEVESVINQHPDIKDSYVYGEKHSSYGHLPVAKVVAQGSPHDNLDLGDLRSYCYRHLAQYKVPKAFELVDKIQRTKSNKIIRH